MQKFFIIKDESYIEKLKKAYIFDKKFIEIMKQMAEEFNLDIKGYYVDYERFSPVFKNIDEIKKCRELGYLTEKDKFKKNSIPNKRFLELLSVTEIHPCPRLAFNFDFRVYGKSSSSQFMFKDIAYGTYEAERDFDLPDKLEEIKASEYYRILEEKRDTMSRLFKVAKGGF